MLYVNHYRASSWRVGLVERIHDLMGRPLLRVSKTEIGHRLRAACQALGLTYKEFAERAGLTQQHLNNYMQGENFPTIPTIVSISQAHGLDLEWLLKGDLDRLSHGVAKKVEKLLADMEEKPEKLGKSPAQPESRSSKPAMRHARRHRSRVVIPA